MAIAVALVDKLDLPWDTFRRRLMDEIAKDPQRPYYESWSAALESMVVDLDLTTPAALDAAEPTERAPARSSTVGRQQHDPWPGNIVGHEIV